MTVFKAGQITRSSEYHQAKMKRLKSVDSENVMTDLEEGMAENNVLGSPASSFIPICEGTSIGKTLLAL